jgi:hypothetical protein
MHHVFFALFDSRTEAESAVREVEALASDGRPFTVFHHPGGAVTAAELPIAETLSREGLLEGVVIGAFGGAATFGVFAALGQLTIGVLGAVFLGLVVGALFGGVYGLLVGAAVPDRVLSAMTASLRPDQVFVTIEAPGLTAEERAIDVCVRHGAQVKKKPLL